MSLSLAEKRTSGFLEIRPPSIFLLLDRKFHCAHSGSHDKFVFSNLHSVLLQAPLKDSSSVGENELHFPDENLSL